MKAFRLILGILIAVLVFGCEKGDSEYKNFKVKDEESLEQTVYVGDTQASLTVDFTTTGPWTSSVEYFKNANESAPSKAGESSEWVTLEPSSGDKAGDYSVTIKLNPEAGTDIFMATITFVCKGEEMQVLLNNSPSVAPGSPDDVNNPEKIKAAMEKLEYGFWDARNAFYDIDDKYSTPDSRKSLNSKNEDLKKVWFESYKAINTCNLLLTACEYEVIKEQEREQVTAKALHYRSMMHLNLATLFGGVPVDTQYPAVSEPVRVMLQEVTDYIMKDCEDYINRSTKTETELTEALFVNAVASLLQAGTFDSDLVYARLIVMIDRITDENFVFEDSNMDGLINQDDSHVGVQGCLFYAYVFSSIQHQKSVDTLNKLAEQLNDDMFRIDANASPDEIKQKVIDILSGSWNRGVKYLVNRFMKNEDWGQHLNLLPIPMDIMSANRNLVQNPGWD